VSCGDLRVVDRLAGGVQDHANIARSLIRTGSDFILSPVGAGKRKRRRERHDQQGEPNQPPQR
jgi:hypothetical protein